MQKEYCLNCQTELNCLDEDPNGDKNCVCAKCRAEDSHDFDREPNVLFNRDGSMKKQEVKQEDVGPNEEATRSTMTYDMGDPTYTGISVQSLRQAVVAFREFLDNPDNGAAKFLARNAVGVLHGYDPDIVEEAMKEADSPYNLKFAVRELRMYRPDYGDNRICWCGHPYYRHFDTYDDMSHVGCKYCGCSNFKEESKEAKIARETKGEQDAK